MQHCAAEAAVPPASFKDKFVVSGGPFWRWSCADCVHILYVWVVLIPNHTMGLSLPILSLPPVLSSMKAKLKALCSFCSSIQTWDEKWNDFILLSTTDSSSGFAASLVHMFVCTPPIPPFLFHFCINCSALLFLGQWLWIDHLSGVQCNDRRAS